MAHKKPLKLSSSGVVAELPSTDTLDATLPVLKLANTGSININTTDLTNFNGFNTTPLINNDTSIFKNITSSAVTVAAGIYKIDMALKTDVSGTIFSTDTRIDIRPRINSVTQADRHSSEIFDAELLGTMGEATVRFSSIVQVAEDDTIGISHQRIAGNLTITPIAGQGIITLIKIG